MQIYPITAPCHSQINFQTAERQIYNKSMLLAQLTHILAYILKI